MIKVKHLITIAFVFTATSGLFAVDWRGFHGVEKQGRCDSATVPLHWSSSQNVAWKTVIPGRGHSSPIVCGDHVYVTTTHETAPTYQQICNYIIFFLVVLFTVTGINFAIERLSTRQDQLKELWQHIKLFLFTLFSVGVIVVVLFGRKLINFEDNAIRCWLTTIMVMLTCLALSSFFVPLKSRLHLAASLLSMVFVVPVLVAFEHKELAFDLGSLKGIITTAAIASPLIFGLAFLIIYFIGRKYKFEVPHTEADAEENRLPSRRFVLTAIMGFVVVLLPLILIIYRSAGYKMPDSYIWDDRVKPDIGWWLVCLYMLVVLVTISGCCWKAIRDRMVTRFARRGLFFMAALLLGTAFFIHSSFLDEKVFVHAVVCLNRNIGKVLWTCKGLMGQTELKHSRTVTHASATPVTHGEHIYGYFGADGLMCVNLEGKLLWKKMEPLFDSKYGAAASPVVKDNILVIVSDVSKSATLPSLITAFNGLSGKVLWQKQRESHKDFATYGTPLVKALNGGQVVIAQGWYDVKGYDLYTGQKLWSYPIVQEGNHLVASLVSDAQHLYVTGPKSVVALDFSKFTTGAAPVLWTTPILGEKSSTPIVSDGLIFLVTEAGMAYCLEAQTGKVLWRVRLKGRYYSSVVAIGNKVLFTNEAGQTTIVALDKAFRVLAENSLREPIYASFAPAGNQTFIRTFRHLYCIQVDK